MQQNFRQICVHESTYEKLRKMGTVDSSFDKVITHLLERVETQEQEPLDHE
jgi:predicted CopG family antitoxin